MIGKSRNNSLKIEDITAIISEGDILYHYLGISNVPCVIQSPLRTDHRPSFGLYSMDCKSIYYKDFSTGDKGSLFNLLQKLWGVSFQDTLKKINSELIRHNPNLIITASSPKNTIQINKMSHNNTSLNVKTRDWKDHDIKYWESYGVALKWLKWAGIYPVSHIIITKDNRRYCYAAEKYAYCFVEFKDGNTTLKVYQPFSKTHKWSNKHDRSVISLWTKIPEYGKRVVICSSIKDALCLSCNTGIPALSVQGEGYGISETAIKELKRRFTKQYIILDNDSVGIEDARKLSAKTGFINITLPVFEGGKDISDAYKVFGKQKFIEIIKKMFSYESQGNV